MGGIAPGPSIDGYRDFVRIGRGGFSTVYRARHDRLDRDVAIKVLSIDLTDAADIRRFETECRVLGRLGRHPHIVDVYDAGVDGNGSPYIVMKYYAGGTLGGQVNSRGAFEADEVARQGVLLAGALAEAHHQGIIHRDIKPENVLLDDDGSPVLTDFGVAAVADPDGRFTSSIAFSRAYVAPEVLDRNEYGVASDIYSLGATLYTLLTGRPVFAATTEARTVLAVMTEEPEPIGRTDVSPELEAVVLNCLSKDPDARLGSALALAASLRDIDPGASGFVASVPVAVASEQEVAVEPGPVQVPDLTETKARRLDAAAPVASSELTDQLLVESLPIAGAQAVVGPVPVASPSPVPEATIARSALVTSVPSPPEPVHAPPEAGETVSSASASASTAAAGMSSLLPAPPPTALLVPAPGAVATAAARESATARSGRSHRRGAGWLVAAAVALLVTVAAALVPRLSSSATAGETPTSPPPASPESSLVAAGLTAQGKAALDDLERWASAAATARAEARAGQEKAAAFAAAARVGASDADKARAKGDVAGAAAAVARARQAQSKTGAWQQAAAKARASAISLQARARAAAGVIESDPSGATPDDLARARALMARIDAAVVGARTAWTKAKGSAVSAARWVAAARADAAAAREQSGGGSSDGGTVGDGSGSSPPSSDPAPNIGDGSSLPLPGA